MPPLAVPDEPGHPTAAALAGNDCVDLFVERARAARADFVLSDANAAAVAAICRRLDGLPLALELAAARVNVLAPEQILARMDHRLNLLASSRRDLTDRQRTLRGAIDWSYDLLTEPERTFFRRFAVFSGGADLEAAQAVIDPEFELGRRARPRVGARGSKPAALDDRAGTRTGSTCSRRSANTRPNGSPQSPDEARRSRATPCGVLPRTRGARRSAS